MLSTDVDLVAQGADDSAGSAQSANEAGSLSAYLRSCERELILHALQDHGWRVTETAEGLGISRKNLWEKMRKLNVQSRPE